MSSPNNSYQWYKDGTAIADATSKDYTISPLNLADSGVYYVTANNSIVTGLTLQRHDIVLTISTDSPCDELRALRALYESTDGPNWTNNTGWPQTDAEWSAITSIDQADAFYGVTVVGGNVTRLNFLRNNLVGSLPSQISSLCQLEYLDLFFNRLSGDLTAWDISSNTNLIRLSLFNNQLTGDLSSWDISSNVNLESLLLNSNQLTGDLSSWDISSNVNLESLWLNNNQLNGEDLSTWDISSNVNLKSLLLNDNLLTGDLPAWDLSSNVNLISLELGFNVLTGNLSTWDISSNVNLERLFLNNNQLNGEDLSTWDLSSNVNLVSLLLNNNQLTGDLSSWDISSNVNLESLWLNNNQLNGEDLSTWDLSSNVNLESLLLNDNLLTGDLPAWDISSNVNLESLLLDDNLLTGNLSDWDISSNINLIRLSLNDNLLTGDLASWDISSNVNLEYLNLSDNRLAGDATVWDLSPNVKMSTLLLSNNHLTFTVLLPFASSPGITSFRYSPQKEVGVPDTLIRYLGEPLVLSTTIDRGTTPACSYRWYKGTTPITSWGISNHTVTVSAAAGTADAGVYTYRITNTDLPGLTLTSYPITVQIADRPAAPVISDVALCATGLSATLSPEEDGDTRTFRWYANISDTTPLYEGESFVTPALTATTTYYVTRVQGEAESLRVPVTVYLRNLTISTFDHTSATCNNLYGGGFTFLFDSVAGAFVAPAKERLEVAAIDSTGLFGYHIVSEADTLVSGTGIIGTPVTIDSLTAGNYVLEITSCLASTSVTILFTDVADDSLEIAALKALYDSTDGANWTNNTGWPQTDAEWAAITSTDQADAFHGVTIANGEVTRLNLRNNNLVGSLPSRINGLCRLINLNLSANHLTGDLSNWEISANGRLVTLNLSDNQLSGDLAEFDVSSNTRLKYFYADRNQLIGDLSAWDISANEKLRSLSLHRNGLEGNLADWDISTNEDLRYLSLNDNQLSGNLSGWDLSMNKDLKHLSLSNNQLSGTIPASLSLLPQLNFFLFHNNAFVFSDFESEHPSYIANLTGYSYSPQAKVDRPETIHVALGESFTLTTEALTSPNNHYQWQISRDGGATFTDIGTDSDTYTVSAAAPTHAGLYRFFATNDIVTGLTLERHTIAVNVTPTGTPNVCFSGQSRRNRGSGSVYNELSLDLLDGSEIIRIDARVTKGFRLNDTEVALAESFDARGNADFSCDSPVRIRLICGSIYQSFEVQYFIESTSGIYQGTKIFTATDITLDARTAANFECDRNTIGTPGTVDDDNTFCYRDYNDDLLIENLYPRGDTIAWYATASAEEAFDSDDEIPEAAEESGGITLWWENVLDIDTTRTPEQVVIYSFPEADTEQTFSKYAPPPTLADIEIYNSGDTVYWYTTPVGGTALNGNALLTDNTTYYATACDTLDAGCTCRLPVTTYIGVIPPKGELVQVLCKNATLADIVLETEAALTTVWYDSETGGTILPDTTTVTDDTRYYATQKDNTTGEESGDRLTVMVLTRTVDPPVVPESPQRFYAYQSRTVGDLRAYGEAVKWYSQATGGVEYNEATALEDGATYYAGQLSDSCASAGRVPVTVIFDPLEAKPLIGCEHFRPELLGHYVIDVWVNEREVETEVITDTYFNGSEESQLFVKLLNHLKNRLLSKDKNVSDTPAEYQPQFAAGEEEVDFTPLMAFIEGLTEEKKLIVYDFRSVFDDFGRTIGFTFHLNETDRGTPTRQFKYLSPTFTYTVPRTTGSGVVRDTRTVHYPLRDYRNETADDLLQFTKVELDDTTGEFVMYSDFNLLLFRGIIGLQPREIYHEESQESRFTALGVIKPYSTYNRYREVAYQAPLTYAKSVIEISFVDEEGAEINSPIVYRAQGEIIDKWQKITGDFVIPNSAGVMSISLKNNDTDKVVYFDDLRIQPFESNMKTFVYHPENRLLMSELDENNYATYYEYDNEDGLIRVKKETVKGVYTIRETRSGNVKRSDE